MPQGDISSVYVRPEARGVGLDEETVRKELEKEFVHRKFVVYDTASTPAVSIARSSKGI